VVAEADDALVIVVAPGATLVCPIRAPVALRPVPVTPGAAIRLLLTRSRNRTWGWSLFSGRFSRLLRSS
jgi:hypothetical protein